MAYFLINENGEVYNTISWDGDTVNNPYPLPRGHQIKTSDVAGIGWAYNKDTDAFTPPDPME